MEPWGNHISVVQGNPAESAAAVRVGSAITRAELASAIQAAPMGVGNPLAADPLEHADYVANLDLTVDLIRRRIENRSTPRDPVGYRWPKDDLSQRAMTHLDPLDEHLYRALAGRFLRQMQSRLDPDRVLAAVPKPGRPFWTLKGHAGAIQTRTETALTWLETGDVECMVTLDVENYFYSVQPAITAASLAELPGPNATRRFIHRWLVDLAKRSGVPGLPVGHDPSQVIANHLLVPADRALGAAMRWLRYMDDLWMFAESDVAGVAGWQAYEQVVTTALRLRLNERKCTLIDADEARDKVRSEAIEYLQGPTESEGIDAVNDLRDHEAELLEYSLADPTNRKRELRRAITLHHKRGRFQPLEALKDDPDLLGLAPDHWARLLTAHVEQTKRRDIDWDWIRESAIRTRSSFNDAERLVFLPSMRRSRCDKATGIALHELAMQRDAAPPVAARAALVWTYSDGARQRDAIDGALDGCHHTVRRAFVASLRKWTPSKKVTDRILSQDEDLAPTLRWALAA